MSLTRRGFLWSSAAALASTALLPGASFGARINKVNGEFPLGFQAFEIVPDLKENWRTLELMVRMGYSIIDMVAMNPYTLYTGRKLRAEFNGVGLECNVCHYGHGLWENSFGLSVDFAHQLSVRHVICGPRRGMKTTEDWKQMADDLNRYGAASKREGLIMAYHNHEIEFIRTPEGDIPWDLLMAHTDPDLVRFQIDVGNLTFGGGDAIEYFRKYNDRYFSFHAKDFKPGMAAVPVGEGVLDWKEIFRLARQAQVESCIAEVGAYGAETLSGAPLEATELTILELYERSAKWLLAYRE